MNEYAVRAAFEDYITAPPFEDSIERFCDDPIKSAWPGNYKNYHVQLAWDAWKNGIQWAIKNDTSKSNS